MKWKFIAGLSLALNGALIVAWVSSRRTIVPSELAPASLPEAFAASVTPSATTNPATEPAVRPFHWSQVESADYLTYIANLRRIGCPEATLRDIIVADVNSLFAPRYAALAGTAPEMAWWGWYDRRKPLRDELAASLRALDEEKLALLSRLLGARALAELPIAATTVTAVRDHGAWAFLPESKQAALRELLRRHQAVLEWNQAQSKGLPSDEQDARRKAWGEARGRELAALLSPNELREFALRDSPTAEVIREQQGRANLTEAEYRRLFDLRQEFERTHPETRPEDWKQLDDAYARALGADRFADIQRQNDSMWVAMQSTAAEHGISPEGRLQAYAIKREYTDRMVEAVGRMFADPQQNPQPLRDLAAEMDARLASILGPAATKQLDQLGVLPRLVIQDDGQKKSYSLSRGGFVE
jgi:hypothetical protein